MVVAKNLKGLFPASLPISVLSIMLRSSMTFLAELCFPVNPLQSTVTGLPASVDSKRLTEKLGSLESTLTKNRGSGLPCSPAPCLRSLPAVAALYLRRQVVPLVRPSSFRWSLVVFPRKKLSIPSLFTSLQDTFPLNEGGTHPPPLLQWDSSTGSSLGASVAIPTLFPRKPSSYLIHLTERRLQSPGARRVYTVGEKA